MSVYRFTELGEELARATGLAELSERLAKDEEAVKPLTNTLCVDPGLRSWHDEPIDRLVAHALADSNEFLADHDIYERDRTLLLCQKGSQWLYEGMPESEGRLFPVNSNHRFAETQEH